MKPYYYKQMDKESSIPDKTFAGQNLILPKIMVPPGSQTANPPQSPQVVAVVSSPEMESQVSDKKANILCGLGATHLTIGLLEVLFNIGANVMWAHVAGFAGAGYWCGVFTILTGSFGIAAGKRKGRCLVLTFMVLSIITTVLTVILMITSAMGIADAHYACCWSSNHRDAINTTFAWNSLLLIAGIIEFIISIVSVAMCWSTLYIKPRSTVLRNGPSNKYKLDMSKSAIYKRRSANLREWPTTVPSSAVHQQVMIPQQPG